MLKTIFIKLLINAFVAGLIIASGAALDGMDPPKYFDGFSSRDLGAVVAYSGLVYGIVAGLVCLLPVFRMGFGAVEKVNERREQDRALEDLLKYKKLLDEGILTHDEYAKKSAELKRHIL